MATFDDLESSTEGSRPAELYAFTLGGFAFTASEFLYTSAEDAITIGGDTYQPEAIDRSPIALSPEDRKQLLEVTLPSGNAFASQYISIVPGNRASLSIWQIQRDETPSITTKLRFQGRVRSVRFTEQGEKAVIGAQTIEAVVGRRVPRYSYSIVCNHALYGPGCGATPQLHSGNVTAISGSTITVSGASAFPDGHFNAGYVKPSGLDDRRLVLSHVGNDLTLLLPFGVSISGLAVDVFVGCNHLASGDCSTKHSNVARNGGWPFVPTRDLWTKGI